MKLKAAIEITIEVSDEQAKRILDNDKSAFLMTMYNGNSKDRPDLGKWYLEGNYKISGEKLQVYGKIE